MGQRHDNPFDAIIHGQLAGIQHHSIPGPVFVVAALNAFPIGQIKSNDIAATLLYPAPVFSAIRAGNFHVQQSCTAGFCGLGPPPPCQLNGIHRVCNDIEAVHQIVFRDGDGRKISGILGRMDLQATVFQGCLDRIHAYVNGADFLRQGAGHGGFADSRQTRK